MPGKGMAWDSYPPGYWDTPAQRQLDAGCVFVPDESGVPKGQDQMNLVNRPDESGVPNDWLTPVLPKAKSQEPRINL